MTGRIAPAGPTTPSGTAGASWPAGPTSTAGPTGPTPPPVAAYRPNDAGALRPWEPSAADLDGFRHAQRLAYAGAEAVAATLEAGVTERQAAAAMRRWLTDRGIVNWFHLPFAWFGDRTAFAGFHSPHQFFPTGRRLTEGMPFILDCAPIVNGYTADIGFTSCLGANASLDAMLGNLSGYRALILAAVRRGSSQGDVYREVDALAAQQGYDIRHRAYPFRVLAHRVGYQPTRGGRTVLGFGVGSTATLLRTAVAGARAGRSPLWNRGRFSKQPPEPGIWAVEPHLGWGGVGAKFEELLVVTAGDAYWLDDDLPHVRRWQS
jgi:Xaa-Pro aminopeptidase